MASGQFPFQSKASGSTTAKVTHNFGTEFVKAIIVEPTARHQATIVWLHDFNGISHEASEFVRSFSLDNVKWICPSARAISNNCFGGHSARAWFTVNEFTSSQADPSVIEDLKEAAAHVAGLLKDEPESVMKGVAGYGIGGALALHIASCCALGTYPIQLQAVVGINCWLPQYFNFAATTKSIHGARSRAVKLPILVTHGSDDNMVPYEWI